MAAPSSRGKKLDVLIFVDTSTLPHSLLFTVMLVEERSMALGDSLTSTRHGTIALHLKAHSSGSDQIVKSAQSLSRTPDESVSGYKGSSRAEE